MEVLNSQPVAAAKRFVVPAEARAVALNKNLAEIKEAAQDEKKKGQLFAVIDTLKILSMPAFIFCIFSILSAFFNDFSVIL